MSDPINPSVEEKVAPQVSVIDAPEPVQTMVDVTPPSLKSEGTKPSVE